MPEAGAEAEPALPPQVDPGSRAAQARRGAEFRRGLLARLPKSEVRGLQVADTVQGVAASVDLKSILDLEADTFIGPLEPLAPAGAPGAPQPQRGR
jgi:hypothetical protein